MAARFPSADVYRLGVLLYLIVCGRRPYELAGRSAAEIERVVCESTPVRPSATFDVNGATTDDQVARARGTSPSRLRRRLRGDVDTIVMKALRHEPDRRYATVAALHDDLRRLLGGHPVLARADTVGYRGASSLAVTAAAWPPRRCCSRLSPVASFASERFVTRRGRGRPGENG